MLSGFALPAAPTGAGRKRARAEDAPDALPEGAVLVSSLQEGVAATAGGGAPLLVIPLPAPREAPGSAAAPVALCAAKQVDAATMSALFAPGQTRVAQLPGRSVPLLMYGRAGGGSGGGGGGGGGRGGGRGGNSLDASLAALSEHAAPQDSRYAAIPVGEFGAAMLRGMGAVIAPGYLDEELPAGAGAGAAGAGLKREGNRQRLGLGATANPLAPPPPGARPPRGGATLAAALAEQAASAAAAAAAAAARAQRDANPALKALPGAPHVYPTAIVRLAGSSLGSVSQVDGVPGLDKVRLQRLGEGGALEEVVCSVKECLAFFESGAGEEERALAQRLRGAAAAAEAASRAAPPPPLAAAAGAATSKAAAPAAPPPAAAAAARVYPPGCILKLVRGQQQGQKVLVLSAPPAPQGSAQALLVRLLEGSSSSSSSSAAFSVPAGNVQTVLPKLGKGGKVVLLRGEGAGRVGELEALHTAQFCVDVRLDGGGGVVRGVEYEDVTRQGERS